MIRTFKLALGSLALNIGFCTYYLVVALITQSWWLLTLGVYNLLLSVVRFVVLGVRRNDHFLSNFVGWMFMILTVPLAGTVYLSVVKDRGHVFDIILMISIATYTFAKITLATINLIKSRRSASNKVVLLRRISFANALVSIFALQRSMLVSFEGMAVQDIRIMNILLGSAVSITVFIFGVTLIKKRKNED